MLHTVLKVETLICVSKNEIYKDTHDGKNQTDRQTDRRTERRTLRETRSHRTSIISIANHRLGVSASGRLVVVNTLHQASTHFHNITLCIPSS